MLNFIKMNKNYTILLISFFIYSLASAQVYRISKFNADLLTNKVLVRWSVIAGSTCQEVIVQRSTDSINFKDIYVYPTICGLSNEESNYSWVDEQPINYSLNYYRLKIEQLEFTEIEKVDYNSKLKQGEIAIYPNPVINTAELWFERPKNELLQMEIYSISGHYITEINNIESNHITFDFSYLRKGTYFIKLYSLESDFSQKATLLKQ